ncbi:MAG: hypothetical protein VYD78_01870 [Gemmatimonadota bacterium]|nr:hypothetical protein [Gemmatimonadota bacterium]
MTLEILTFIGGLIVLSLGAELLVSGSSRFASSRGVKPLLVGLTIVSVGTSAPELFISVVASLSGSANLAVGNVLGSNLANVGLVLGISAMIRPLVLEGRPFRLSEWGLRDWSRARSWFATRTAGREAFVMLLITLLALWIIWNSPIGGREGLLLIALAIGYLVWLFLQNAQKEHARVLGGGEGSAGEAVGLSAGTPARARASTLRQWVGIVAGCLGLVIGGFLVRDSALSIAGSIGMSERAIGLSLVAVGTSLPELATCIVAALRKEGGIVVGNILGSNIFNLTLVLGITSTITPINHQIPPSDFLAVMIISALLVPVVLTESRISRMEGLILLGAYAVLGFWVLS